MSSARKNQERQTKSKTSPSTENEITQRPLLDIEKCKNHFKHTNTNVNFCVKKDNFLDNIPVANDVEYPLYNKFFNNIRAAIREYEGLETKFINDKNQAKVNCPDGQIYIRKQWFPLNIATNKALYLNFINPETFIANQKLVNETNCKYLGHHISIIPILFDKKEYIRFHFTYNIYHTNINKKSGTYECFFDLSQANDIINHRALTRNEKIQQINNLKCFYINKNKTKITRIIDKENARTIGTNYGSFSDSPNFPKDIELLLFDNEISQILFSILKRGLYDKISTSQQTSPTQQPVTPPLSTSPPILSLSSRRPFSVRQISTNVKQPSSVKPPISPVSQPSTPPPFLFLPTSRTSEQKQKYIHRGPSPSPTLTPTFTPKSTLKSTPFQDTAVAAAKEAASRALSIRESSPSFNKENRLSSYRG